MVSDHKKCHVEPSCTITLVRINYVAFGDGFESIISSANLSFTLRTARSKTYTRPPCNTNLTLAIFVRAPVYATRSTAVTISMVQSGRNI